MRTRFANRPEDPEEIIQVAHGRIDFVEPKALPRLEPSQVTVAGWPFDAAEARRRQESVGLPVQTRVELNNDVDLALALIPSGNFIMGSNSSRFSDERPVGGAAIRRPFYMGIMEITNAQYACFDPAHDSAYVSMTNKDHSRRGHPVNEPDQPVVRVAWDKADAFCRWLSDRTGRRFRLPTEAEWEWSCRAGTDTPFHFGDQDVDFGTFANLADQSLERLALRDSPKWHPRDNRFNDGAMVTSKVGGYQPNAWGLFDMQGNAAEWTGTAYRPYPYDKGDGRDDSRAEGTKVVRGGSWYDRPHRATASFRLDYPAWQPVYNVGFRVVMEIE
jgi:formylglycine-generating enzyme required for sulfatase activity